MKVKVNKLTKAQKIELIKEQANALDEKICSQLQRIDGDDIIPFSNYALGDIKELTKSLSDFPSNSVILKEFLAELNLISYDLEEIKTAPQWIGNELLKQKNVVKVALWAAEFKAEADPILSNPQSTIQQVLDVNDKYKKISPTQDANYDYIYNGSSLVAYQDYHGNGMVTIKIISDYEWVEKEAN